MSDLGQLLRKARTEKQISLEELQESTKIRKRYLEAIEEGNYKVLPGNFYVRAFIKQYSEAVGLNPDEVFRLYSHNIPPAESEPAAEPIRMSRRSTTGASSERVSKWLSAFLMVAFPLLIVTVVYYFYYMNHDTNPDQVLPDDRITDSSALDLEGKQPEPPSVDQQPAADPEPEPDAEPEPEPDVVYVDNFKWSKNTIDRYGVSNADKIKLELTVVGAEAWVGVTHADSKSKWLYQKTLKKGETYTGEFDHNIYVNIGNAGASQMKVNGVEIDLGTAPDPRKFQFELGLVPDAAETE